MTLPKVTLIAVPHFEVKVGEKSLGVFRQTGEMAGMLHLLNAERHQLVVDTGGPFSAAFIGLGILDAKNEVSVLKASPVLVALIEPKAPAAEGGAPCAA